MSGPVEIPSFAELGVGIQAGWSPTTGRIAVRILVGGMEVLRETGPVVEKGGDVSSWCEDMISAMVASGLVPREFENELRARTQAVFEGEGFVWKNQPGKVTVAELVALATQIHKKAKD